MRAPRDGSEQNTPRRTGADIWWRCDLVAGFQLAKLSGGDVMLLTHSAAKQALGADLVASFEAEARAQWPLGADFVVECAGDAATVTMSPGLTRTGGRVVVLGVLPSGAQVPIEPFDLLFSEIQLHFSFMNVFTHGRDAKMIADGVIEVSQLISRKISLTEAAGAIYEPALIGEVRTIVVPEI